LALPLPAGASKAVSDRREATGGGLTDEGDQVTVWCLKPFYSTEQLSQPGDGRLNVGHTNKDNNVIAPDSDNGAAPSKIVSCSLTNN
jgi:hypothetical protein